MSKQQTVLGLILGFGFLNQTLTLALLNPALTLSNQALTLILTFDLVSCGLAKSLRLEISAQVKPVQNLHRLFFKITSSYRYHRKHAATFYGPLCT